MSVTLAAEALQREIRSGYYIYRWDQGPRIGPTFTEAESSFIFGRPHAGKTRLAVRLALKFRAMAHAKVIDAFGAENDNESTVHILNPEYRDRTLMVVGNEVKVDGWDLVLPISKFDKDTIEDPGYEVIVTDRALFGPADDKKWDRRYYAALARIFELCKRRRGHRQIVNLVIREAWNVVYSVIQAGISFDEQSAMREFRKMHSQRFHSNVAPTMDTLRYIELATSVRTCVDHRYLKGFGAQPIPDELSFLFKPHLFSQQTGRDWMMRNLPKQKFILLAARNGVAEGWYRDIPWHIEKGFSPLDKLNIVITTTERGNSEAPAAEKGNNGGEQRQPGYLPSINDQHAKMAELKAKEMSYQEIARYFESEGIEMSWQKVRYHLQAQCACVVTIASSTNQPTKTPSPTTQEKAGDQAA